MGPPKLFSPRQVAVVREAVTMSEDVVSDIFKLSHSQWLRHRYDVRTLAQLNADEVLDGPFAQVTRYRGQRPGTSLGSGAYDFYKICLQDHVILETLKMHPDLSCFTFILYIVVHELIHIVRFGRFAQSFEASVEETLAEEARVHRLTRDILQVLPVPGRDGVLRFFAQWHGAIDALQSPG
jgi:hypothetical protein